MFPLKERGTNFNCRIRRGIRAPIVYDGTISLVVCHKVFALRECLVVIEARLVLKLGDPLFQSPQSPKHYDQTGYLKQQVFTAILTAVGAAKTAAPDTRAKMAKDFIATRWRVDGRCRRKGVLRGSYIDISESKGGHR